MNKLMKIALGLVLMLGVASCELFNVDVESTLSGTLDIAVQQEMSKGTADVHPFDASTTIDPLEDPDVEEYADKIVDVGVDGVVAEVEYVSESDVVFYTGSTFSISNSNSTAEYTLDEDWPIEVGTTVSLEDLGGFYDDMSEILLDLEVFTLAMTGTSSKSGVEVTIRIDIETTMTGNPF